jgi:hypothetical protein
MVLYHKYLENYRLYFLYYLKSNVRFQLDKTKSQVEARRTQNLIDTLKFIGERDASFLIEGGWYFNRPDKLKSQLRDYGLHYFILRPTRNYLHKAYLRRTPRSSKNLNNDADWANYDRKILIPQLRHNEKILAKLNDKETTRIVEEDLQARVRIVYSVIKQREKDPVIFIITGPNTSGKSTLFVWTLAMFFGIVDNDKLERFLMNVGST